MRGQHSGKPSLKAAIREAQIYIDAILTPSSEDITTPQAGALQTLRGGQCGGRTEHPSQVDEGRQPINQTTGQPPSNP